jgi:hypothetical protein
MRKWIAFVFIAVICLAGCAEQNYPAYDAEIPETLLIDEDIPYIVERLSRRINLHYSLAATPDVIVRSADELHEFAETFIFSHSPSDRYESYVIRLMARFDDDFFEDRMLIISYVPTDNDEQNARLWGISHRSEDTLHLRIGAYMPNWVHWRGPWDAYGEYVFFISLEHMDEITTIVRLVDEEIPYTMEHLSRWILPHYSLQATPDNIVRSVDEWRKFAETYLISRYPTARERPYFAELLAMFDDDFFEDRMLILSFLIVRANENAQLWGVSLRSEDTLHLKVGGYVPFSPWSITYLDAYGHFFFFISVEHMDEITTIVRR